jgi:hypothetical protein
LIRRGVGALRLPNDLGQTLQQRVLGVVFRAGSQRDALEVRADALRLVDRQLLFHRKMQRQVQEGIQTAIFRQVIVVEMALRIIKQHVILGMQ